MALSPSPPTSKIGVTAASSAQRTKSSGVSARVRVAADVRAPDGHAADACRQPGAKRRDHAVECARLVADVDAGEKRLRSDIARPKDRREPTLRRAAERGDDLLRVDDRVAVLHQCRAPRPAWPVRDRIVAAVALDPIDAEREHPSNSRSKVAAWPGSVRSIIGAGELAEQTGVRGRRAPGGRPHERRDPDHRVQALRSQLPYEPARVREPLRVEHVGAPTAVDLPRVVDVHPGQRDLELPVLRCVREQRTTRGSRPRPTPFLGAELLRWHEWRPAGVRRERAHRPESACRSRPRSEATVP